MKKIALLSLVLIAFMQINNCQPIPDSALYLGQTPPGNTPIVFAPEIISLSDRAESVITISPDNTQIFFSTGKWPNRITKYMEYKNEQWTSPATALFSINRSADEPIFSPDGKKVYYYAYLPSSTSNSDIYFSVKTEDTWGQPESVANSINSKSDEWHPCIVNDSSVYFINGSGAICKSQYINGKYENRTVLPTHINDGTAYGDPYVSPNESYMILNSKRSGGSGGIDLYISFAKEDKSWTNPKNLGNKINSSADDYSGDITPDGKYMTFGRNDDIYWVSSSFIDSLKQTNCIPYIKNKIANQTDTLGTEFSYTIPDSTFIDDDGNNTLTYLASLNSDNNLPSWLSFNSLTKTFSGKPDIAGTLSLKVTATDTAKANVSCTFTLKVINSTTSIKQTVEPVIQVYPNPTKDIINISFGAKPYKSAFITLTDIAGKSILSNTYNNISVATIDLTDLSKGTYLLNLTIDNRVIYKKICLY